MIDISLIKDYLANSFEHETSVEDGVIFLSNNSKNTDLLQSLRSMLKEWNSSEYVKYQLILNLKESDDFLDFFINKHLIDYL